MVLQRMGLLGKPQKWQPQSLFSNVQHNHGSAPSAWAVAVALSFLISSSLPIPHTCKAH